MGVTLTCLTCGQGNRIPEARLGDGPKCGKCGVELLPDHPVEITFDLLENAARRDTLPLVVDFWAAWCGPCQMMGPEFARAAKSMQGKARFAKLDTEAFPQAGAKYGIRGIPLLIAFQDGHEAKRQAGLMQAPQIAEWVKGAAHV